MKRKVVTGTVSALLAAAFFIGALMTASPAAASSNTAAATPPYGCEWGISADGRTTYGKCPSSAPGNYFRIEVTTCGVSTCSNRLGPWWPQNGVWHGWTPGGWVTNLVAFEFK